MCVEVIKIYTHQNLSELVQACNICFPILARKYKGATNDTSLRNGKKKQKTKLNRVVKNMRTLCLKFYCDSEKYKVRDQRWVDGLAVKST